MITVCEESRRGSFDSESWYHVGYKVPKEIFEEVSQKINIKDKEMDLSVYTKESKGFFTLVLDK